MKLDDPSKFFVETGGLHDARIARLSLTGSRAIEAHVDDIYSAFLDTDEYPGEKRAVISFLKCVHIEMDVDSDNEFINIYDAKCTKVGNNFLVEFAFWPEGRLAVTTGSVHVDVVA